jgi:Sulfotransferase family
MWRSHVRIGTEFGTTLPADRYFELRYEDLVADDVGLARKVIQFLGLVPHDDVIRFCEAQRAERTPYCDPARDLSQGADSSDWASLLSPAQRVRSLELLGDGLIRFGYETRDSLGSKLAAARGAALNAPSVESSSSSPVAAR